MVGLILNLLYACKLALLASSSCVKIIEFLLKNEARKAYLHVHKRIIMPAIYERARSIGCVTSGKLLSTALHHLYPYGGLLFTD